MGLYEDIDPEGTWGAFMHIKVRLDITKPLRRAMKLRGPQGDEIAITFTYERL